MKIVILHVCVTAQKLREMTIRRQAAEQAVKERANEKPTEVEKQRKDYSTLRGRIVKPYIII